MTGRQWCPCGQGAYDECCGPLHRGVYQARTAEELMRSRFSAYALDEVNYLFRTWHARTRPEDLDPPTGVTWRSLEIVEVIDGGVEDEEGIVEFVAHFDTDSGRDLLHERSRFARRAGRWMYLDGHVS